MFSSVFQSKCCFEFLVTDLIKRICVCPSLTQAVSITDAKSLRHNTKHFQCMKLSLDAILISLMGYNNIRNKLQKLEDALVEQMLSCAKCAKILSKMCKCAKLYKNVQMCKIVQNCSKCAKLCKMCKMCKMCKIVQKCANVQRCAKSEEKKICFFCKICKILEIAFICKNVQNCAKCAKLCKNMQ